MNRWCACSRFCLSDLDQWCPGNVISQIVHFFLGELGCRNVGREGTDMRLWSRWVGLRVGAAGRVAVVPSRSRFWVRGGGLGGRERGAHCGTGFHRWFLPSGCRGIQALSGVLSPLSVVPAFHSSHRGVASLRCSSSGLWRKGGLPSCSNAPLFRPPGSTLLSRLPLAS